MNFDSGSARYCAGTSRFHGAAVDGGARPGVTSQESAKLRRPRERHPEGRGYLQGRARPAVPVNVEFGREHACDREDRDLRWGVETICAVLTEHWLNRPVQVLRAPVEGADQPPAAGRDLVEHLPGARRELLGIRRPKSVADPKPRGRRGGPMYAHRRATRREHGAQSRIQSMRTAFPLRPSVIWASGNGQPAKAQGSAPRHARSSKSGIGIPRQKTSHGRSPGAYCLGLRVGTLLVQSPL